MNIPESVLQSTAWGIFQEALRKEIATMREANDSPTLTSEKTLVLRGEIAFAKKLLDAGRKPVAIQKPTPDYYTQ